MGRVLLVFMLMTAQSLEAFSPPDTTANEFALVNPILIVSGTVVLSFFLDNAVQKSNSAADNFNTIGNITNYAGEKTILVPTLLITYGLGRFILKDSRIQDVSLASIKSVVVTAIFTESLKHITGRARPFVDMGPYKFSPFPGSNDQYKSLPSGHASLAFAVFTPFAEEYSRWIYLMPISVGAGRVFQNKHWLSDVAIGSGIGFLSGYFFYHKKKRVEPIANGMVIYF